MVNLETYLIENVPTYEDAGRYLKNKYLSNDKRFKKRFLEPLSTFLQMNDIENHKDIISFYESLWEIATPFTYKEAFSIQKDEFRALVFSTIRVPEMVKELGHKRIASDGIELVNKVYNPIKKEFEDVPFTQVYEVHEVNGTKLGLNTTLYAIKCWCTSTDNEHWLWLDKKYDCPLEAIASTCKIYKSMKGNIKHIIRQGDVFIHEMKEDILPEENEEIISLTKKEYFSLLKSQS